MNDISPQEQVKAEKDRGHFPRAAYLAMQFGFPEEQVRELQQAALWQISAVYRNTPGTKRLAQQYGLSKDQLKRALEELLKRRKSDGESKSLEPCYDHATERYLTFQEWLEHLLKVWDKLPSR